ncbi:unnamed protein product [Phytomonas sp. Hart1]|nr:unnamed protein product [Phytomonas sp. Hart1]|eukprot:CCW66093.1 unnamed protein product [Phytomonas sp. isolate Hart1]
MDYRSPLELRQQLMEEAKSAAAQSTPAKKTKLKVSGLDAAFGTHLAGNIGSSATVSHSAFTPLIALPDDPTALVREVPEAENIKAMNAALEHEEAVQRYVESENLSLEESAKYIMANGSTAQKMSFVLHIRKSLVGYSLKQISRILGILVDSMWTQDPELQCRVPEALQNLAGFLTSSIADDLYDVIETMLTVKTPSIRIAWGKLLLALISYLSNEQIEKCLIPLSLAKSQHVEPQDQRELSCDLLGNVCAYVHRDTVDKMILPRAMALCQDTNVAVRERMCQHLRTIAHSLGIDAAKQKVAPILIELLNDEERAVSGAAFSRLLDLIDFFGPEYCKIHLYPIFMTYVSNPPSDVTSLLVVEYGRFLDKIKSNISMQDEFLLFASFYQKAVEKNDKTTRRSCAYNFPAVAASLPLSVFSLHLSPCLNKLANDPEPEVRRSTAAGLHELVKILGNTAAMHLQEPFLSLLGDKDGQVRFFIFKHVDLLLDSFIIQLTGTQRDNFFQSVAEILLELAPTGHTNWHIMDHIVTIVSRYAQYFSSPVIIDDFIPLMLYYEKVGANVLKNKCAKLVMLFLSQVSIPHAQVQLFNKLVSEFARSPCCYHRQSYFRFVREATFFFSRRCIRERLMESSLELQRDSIAEVRKALASSLVYLAKGLRSSCPGALEEEYKNMIQRLLMDENQEVQAEARRSTDLLKAMEIERRSNPKKATDEEQLDLKREKAEQAMLDLAKEFDKAERRAKLRELLKNGRDKEFLDVGVAVNPRKGANGRTCGTPKRRRSLHNIVGGYNIKNTGSSSHTNVELPRLLNVKSTASPSPTYLRRKR